MLIVLVNTIDPKLEGVCQDIPIHFGFIFYGFPPRFLGVSKLLSYGSRPGGDLVNLLSMAGRDGPGSADLGFLFRQAFLQAIEALVEVRKVFVVTHWVALQSRFRDVSGSRAPVFE